MNDFIENHEIINDERNKYENEAVGQKNLVPPENRGELSDGHSKSEKIEANVQLGDASNKKRRPTCSRCRNHDKIIPTKNHKRICPYNSCVCPKCAHTSERKEVRARIYTEKKMRDKLDVKYKNLTNESKSLPLQQLYVEPNEPINIHNYPLAHQLFENKPILSNGIQASTVENGQLYGSQSTSLSVETTNQAYDAYEYNIRSCNLCDRSFFNRCFFNHLTEYHKVDNDKALQFVNIYSFN